MSNRNYFTLFNLPLTFRQDEDTIKNSFLKLQREIHPDNFVNAMPQEKRLSMEYAALVNEAYRVLLNPLNRAFYLLSLRGLEGEGQTDIQMPLDFLTNQITFREQIAEGEYRSVKQVVAEAVFEIKRILGLLLDNHDPLKWEEARLKVYQWKFYARLQEEIEVIENEDSTNITACF